MRRLFFSFSGVGRKNLVFDCHMCLSVWRAGLDLLCAEVLFCKTACLQYFHYFGKLVVYILVVVIESWILILINT